jgi:hypothetical protein
LQFSTNLAEKGGVMKSRKDMETGALATIKPEIFTVWSKKKMDGRARDAKWLKQITQGLVSGFLEPVPPAAQLIAKQAAFKALSLVKFECFVLSGGDPSKTADATYLSLSNSLRADLESLARMAKEPRPEEPMTLQEYIRQVKAKEKASKAIPVNETGEEVDDLASYIRKREAQIKAEDEQKLRDG